MKDKSPLIVKDQAEEHIWFLWGVWTVLDKRFNIVGTHPNYKDGITLYEGEPRELSTKIADRSLSTKMSFPESGVWKIDMYDGPSRIRTIYVKVEGERENTYGFTS